MIETIGLAAAVQAALQTRLLASLIATPGTAEQHARALSLDPRATRGVLDVLVAFGIAQRTGDTIAASPELARMATDAPGGVENLIGLWSHVPQFLRTGAPFAPMDTSSEATYAKVVGALGRMFAPIAAELAGKLSPAPARVLDIGCGSGVWSLAIAQHVPTARITGLDRPTVLEAFRARATELGVADRTDTIPGDVHEVEIPRAFDLVVIANVLRIESVERAKRIVERAAAAVTPGGRLLIVDAIGGGTPAREQSRAVYGLHLTMRSATGRVYAPAEITAWMTAAHITGITSIELSSTHGAVGALIGRLA